MAAKIDPNRFVRILEPLLAGSDTAALADFLKQHYTKEELTDLLRCKCNDARKIAALSLSLVGCRRCADALLKQLQDPDPVINEMAEHALWSIWLRSGTCKANNAVCRGSHALADMRLDEAVKYFTQAIELDATFAEAYNQRAIAHYLAERWEESLADGRRTVELIPGHFGALSGMGHCHAHLRQYRQAIECYERSLKINPHLSCVAEALAELKKRRLPDAP